MCVSRWYGLAQVLSGRADILSPAANSKKSSSGSCKQETSGIEPDVGVEPTTLRCDLFGKSLTLYRLS
jgi:hypothetical protein